MTHRLPDVITMCDSQAGLEEARASQLEAQVGSLRLAAYRAPADKIIIENMLSFSGCLHQAGLEEARAGQLEALVGSLRSAAYRATADSQAHGSRTAGAESRSAQLQAEVQTLGSVQSSHTSDVLHQHSCPLRTCPG